MSSELITFTNAVELNDVWLKHSDCECSSFPTNVDINDLSIEYGFKVNYSLGKDKILICYIICSVEAFNKDDDSKDRKTVMSFNNCFALVYDSNRFKNSPSDETLRKFLLSTALFNSYPYVRELVQNQSVRMGVGPIVLPLHKSAQAMSSAKTKKSINPESKTMKKKTSKKAIKKTRKK